MTMRIPTVSFCFTLIVSAFAQTPPEIDWQRCLGGTEIETVRGLQQTTDNGYITIGNTSSANGQVTGYNGGYSDIWVVKTNELGELQWQRAYGGSDSDSGNAIRQTSDGGFVLAGSTRSNNGDVSGNHGSNDALVIKTDNTGTIEWQRCYGGSGVETCYAIKETPDGGYVFCGETQSSDGDVTFNNGSTDTWVVKVDATGAIQWQRAVGGSSLDWSYSLDLTNDGGFVIAGISYSNDGDITNNQGEMDMCVVKLDGNGTLLWQKTYGGSQSELARRIIRANDGGYFVCGSTSSTSGDVTGHHGFNDAWVLKLSDNGALEWQKALGGSSSDYAADLVTMPDGGCIVTGGTGSDDGEVSTNHGEDDVWLVRLSDQGALLWERSFGGTGSEGASQLVRTVENGYALAGYTTSNNGDVSGNHGAGDFWVVKLSADLTAIPELYQVERLSIFPNPAEHDQVVRFNLQRTARVRLEVQDASGRSVLLMDQGVLPPGEQSLTLPMSALRSGAYFVMVHVHDAVFRVHVVKV